MPATFGFLELFPGDDVRHRLRKAVRDASDISINTGHPQGGNAMSASPTKGVVDPSGRVHGWRNLFVADASVFPSATTVNPQLTVMALAHQIGSGATW
jgi:choline dehydrogenase-like flavoprotein